MSERIVRPERATADDFRREADPSGLAGHNSGMAGPHPEKNTATAYDVKGIHRRLDGYTDDELQRIPILPEGSRLEQGATYIDLADPEFKEFTATAEMVAGPHNRYVPKTEVNYRLWNRLIGVENPERTGQADEV